MKLTDLVGRLTHRPHPPQESWPDAGPGVVPPFLLRRRQAGRTGALAANDKEDAPPSCAPGSPPSAAVEPAGHGMIAGSRIEGVPVFSDDGARWGEIRDLAIDKPTGRIIYALVAMNDAEELGERLYPVPWSLLRFDHENGGYIVPVDGDLVPAGPGLSPAELEAFGAGHRTSRGPSPFDYNPILVMPFI